MHSYAEEVCLKSKVNQLVDGFASPVIDSADDALAGLAAGIVFTRGNEVYQRSSAAETRFNRCKLYVAVVAAGLRSSTTVTNCKSLDLSQGP